jgi:hypothetical protein
MTTPVGDEWSSNDAGWLRERILHAGPSFWNTGAGSAAVHKGQKWIELVFHETYGFWLAIHEQDDRETYVPWQGPDFGEAVKVYVGGEPTFYPQAEFVSRETGWKIVDEFCKTGSKLGGVTWFSSTDIGWDYSTGKSMGPPPSASK